jgi:hypothetical protein
MARYLRPSIAINKAMEIKSALFISASTSVLKIQNQLINALHADEIGQVWFCIPPPFKCIKEMDKEFPAKLDFFKKEKGFYLNIAGKAFVVDDPEELNHLTAIPSSVIEKITEGKTVLIKLHIKEAIYFNRQSYPTLYYLHNLKVSAYKFIAKWRMINFKKIAFINLYNLLDIFSN